MNYKDKPNLRDSSRERVVASIDKSLKNLGTDYVDVYLVHWPDRHTPFEETMQALDDIVREGKVRFVGLSNFKLDEIEACMAVRRVDVVQYGWNMFDRRMQTEILPYCAEHGVGFMAYGSLAFGLLTGTFTEDHDFGSADWRARQGNMGAIKMFAALFGPEKFKDNVRAVEELKVIAGALRQEPAAARVALGDLAPRGQHRARRLPHGRRGRGQRRRDRLVDQRRRPRRDRRDLRPPRRRHHAPTSGSRRCEPNQLRARGQGRDRHRGASGIGRAMVERFVEEGARVVVADVDAEGGARRSPSELGDGAVFQPTDVADADQMQAAVDLAVEHFGGLARHVQQRGHRRVAHAVPRRRLRRLRPGRWRVNIFGVMVGSQRAARHMADHGGGAIVNTTSIGGINAGGGVMAYRASKAAVIHITRSIAVELAAKNIRVNCIAPAHIPTAINAAFDQSRDRAGDAAAAARRVAARRRRGGAVPRERPRRADHRHRAARRRRHHRRFPAALDEGSAGTAAPDLDEFMIYGERGDGS